MINKQRGIVGNELAPNIVNVATITGVTTYHSGIAVTGGKGSVGITTVVSNAVKW